MTTHPRPPHHHRNRRRSPDRRGDRGSAAVELALLAPIAVLLMLLVVAVGRQIQTRMQIDGAAATAARAATTARTPTAARQAAAVAVAAGHLRGTASCRQLAVAVDTSDFRPGGTVRATVSCTVDLTDLVGLRLPATRTMSSSATAELDLYRAVDTTGGTP